MTKQLLNRWALAGLLLVLPTWGTVYYFVGEDHHHHHVAWALLVVVLFVVVTLTLFEWSGRTSSSPARRQYGFLEVTIGADGRFSTSKTMVALWTLVLAAALMLMSGLAWFTNVEGKDVFGGDWNSYFLLLGGPFASAVLAKGIVAAHVEADPAAKSSTPAVSGTAVATSARSKTLPHAGDLVSNDAGDTDLVASQYVLFTLVAILYFVGELVTNVVHLGDSADGAAVVLPSIPSALLGLTSLAAATYVGNKAVGTQGLRIVTMEPPNPAPKDSDVTITLVNLPATATVTNTFLTCHGSADPFPIAPTSVAGPKISFRAPGEAGTYQIAIVGPDTVAGPLTLTVI